MAPPRSAGESHRAISSHRPHLRRREGGPAIALDSLQPGEVVPQAQNLDKAEPDRSTLGRLELLLHKYRLC